MWGELSALLYASGALLLVLAGALKVVDPSGTVGALRALGVEVDAIGIRILAGAELVLGALALAVSSEVLAICVALSYVLFGAVTVVAILHDVPIDSCGCLGRLETPPRAGHLVVIVGVLLGAAGQAIDPGAALLERLSDDGGDGLLFTLGALVLTVAAVALFRTGRRPSTLR